MFTPRIATARRAIALSLGTALLLSGCAAKAPKVVVAPPSPPPVGHVYPVAVALPAPVSPRIKFTAAQTEQDQQAFNVIALKSALMVGALTCGQQSQYDAFMTAYQPHVLAAQHVMDTYFHKASGPYSGQKMEDDYVTLLANNQTLGGQAQGGMFCLNNAVEFTAVMALKTSDDLDHFVTDQPPATEVAAVPAAPAPAVMPAKKPVKSVKHKKTVKTASATPAK